MNRALLSWAGCIVLAVLHVAYGRDPSAYLAAAIVIGAFMGERK
jgi:hypothetical protein